MDPALMAAPPAYGVLPGGQKLLKTAVTRVADLEGEADAVGGGLGPRQEVRILALGQVDELLVVSEVGVAESRETI